MTKEIKFRKGYPTQKYLYSLIHTIVDSGVCTSYKFGGDVWGSSIFWTSDEVQAKIHDIVKVLNDNGVKTGKIRDYRSSMVGSLEILNNSI